MGLHYRLVGRVGALDGVESAHGLATAVFADWMAGKGYDTSDLTPGHRKVANDTTLLSTQDHAADGSRTTTLQLRETKPKAQQRWVTTLTVRSTAPAEFDPDAWDEDLDPMAGPSAGGEGETGSKDWLQIDLEFEPLADGGRPPVPTVPQVARAVLEALPILDGDVRLTTTPVYIGEFADLDHLVGLISSPSRRLPVLVAAERVHDSRTTSLHLYGDLAFNVAGYGAMVVVAGAQLESLNSILGPLLQLRPGQIRTFAPRPRPSDPDDALRHRLMGVRTATQDVWRASRTLAIQPRKRALELPLPPALAEVRRAAARADREAANQHATDAADAAKETTLAADETVAQFFAWLQQAPLDSDQPMQADLDAATAERDQAREQARHLASQLEATAASSRRVSEQLEALQVRTMRDQAALESAEFAAAYAAEARDAEIVAHDATAAALTNATDRLRYLERRALDYQDVEAMGRVPDELLTQAPAYLSDLLHAVGGLTNIEFNVDSVLVEALDGHLKAGLWARRAWEALRALDDYAGAVAASSFEGNFHQWVTSTPSGRVGLSPNFVVMTESETTLNAYGEARTFRVPKAVDPTGYALMQAHIRVGDSQPPAPRMHFCDDSTGATGKIHVGYLGPHLPTKATKNQ